MPRIHPLVHAFILLLLVAGSVLPALVSPGTAATRKLRVGKRILVLHTGTEEGSCTVVTKDDVTHVTCIDGDGNLAEADTVLGCLVVAGRGYCAERPWTPDVSGTIELVCGDKAYLLATGTETGQCRRDGDTMECMDSEEDTYVLVECRRGCLRTSNAACCCKVGTNGCRGGANCVGH